MRAARPDRASRPNSLTRHKAIVAPHPTARLIGVGSKNARGEQIHKPCNAGLGTLAALGTLALTVTSSLSADDPIKLGYLAFCRFRGGCVSGDQGEFCFLGIWNAKTPQRELRGYFN
ncbi:hypothetical protein GCM10007920_11550 [Ciceribacter naphthalenivorans]|uniref:Uncharacterized protein n=2 Tax=Alphaproteobacteria TaxID=28211 RepID=A0A512HLD4_9HYPH|nr:hypothetical protein RNA01_31850 [Ciceribacter naphthalenivorans]GLR21369.1 hypothetical protein GCM10007920_11550 [Ciceribacter naphthalenivorans]GLT04225.1 hypothetical protein GCM10007926_11550 [Sphingomonas psychrolutea]